MFLILLRGHLTQNIEQKNKKWKIHTHIYTHIHTHTHTHIHTHTQTETKLNFTKKPVNPY